MAKEVSRGSSGIVLIGATMHAIKLWWRSRIGDMMVLNDASKSQVKSAAERLAGGNMTMNTFLSIVDQAISKDYRPRVLGEEETKALKKVLLPLTLGLSDKIKAIAQLHLLEAVGLRTEVEDWFL